MIIRLDTESANDRVVAATEWHDDASRFWVTYAEDGSELSRTRLEDELPPAQLVENPVVAAAEKIQTEIDKRLAPSSVNSIAETKAAIREGLAAAVEALREGQ